MANEPEAAAADFPSAIVQEDRHVARWLDRSSGWFWSLAAGCLVVALVLTFRAASSSGPTITVGFLEGHGLKPEDSVRYRGIDVGQVAAVHLRDNLDGVDVVIQLRPDAESVAREGSQFWIERPQLSLSRLSGLETVVGAKFVGVIPGPPHGTTSKRFTGLESPPRLRMEQSSPTPITVRFADGNGITAGDVVKYRGIVIGEVTDVRLQPDLSCVIVEAHLTKESRSVARRDSIFWVERAQVNLAGIRGLDTLVGGQYLAVQPGPIGSVPLQDFIGAEEPPPSFNPIEGGLPIRLTCAERFGLERGATITYRGLSAGRVTSVSLSSNAHAIRVLATIHPEYSSLIRANTQFWCKRGLDFHIGLRGVDMAVDPLSTLAAGGIAFATPDPAGAAVEAGHRFELAKEEAAGWIDWRPDFQREPLPKTVGRGQRLLNRIRSPFGDSEQGEVDKPD